MVFVNEWPVPNHISKARTVDHDRGAELKVLMLSRVHSYGSFELIIGEKKITFEGDFSLRFLDHNKEELPPGGAEGRSCAEVYVTWDFSKLRIPESMKEQTDEILKMIVESLEVCKLSHGSKNDQTSKVFFKDLPPHDFRYIAGV